jgi:hypothetical protein
MICVTDNCQLVGLLDLENILELIRIHDALGKHKRAGGPFGHAGLGHRHFNIQRAATGRPNAYCGHYNECVRRFNRSAFPEEFPQSRYF